eukprot:c6425_g1_i1.p1 GENE.c6425_g1_i1~~c6425_g1_i1.p1  ORF type:complete len:185 (+),score=63.23 c6425_g1_i1:56-610(+)
MMSRIFLLCSILLVSLTTVHSVADIAVLKDLETYGVKHDKDLQVTFTIFNLGDEVARDVHVLDAYWPESFVDVIGVRDFTFERVEPKSNVSHSFIVKPTEVGTFSIPPARVLYLESKDSVEPTKSISSSIGYVRVFKANSREQTEAHVFEWTVFGFLAFSAILFPLGVLLRTRSTFPDGLGSLN